MTINIQGIPTPALWIDRGGIVYRTVTDTAQGRAVLIASDYGDVLPIENTGQDAAGAHSAYLSAEWDASTQERSASDAAGAQSAYLSATWSCVLQDAAPQSDAAAAQSGSPSADWLYVLIDAAPQSDAAGAQSAFVSANHN